MNEQKAPPPPDPVATAKAQGDMNLNTATQQQLLNMTNQVTPDGTLTYNQTGTNTFVGADGKTYSVPQFTATTSLSPEAQKIYDINNGTKLNLATIGKDASAKVGGILGTNINLNNDAVESRLMDLGTRRLAPQWARDEEALRTRLVNQGIKEGSAAWDTEMNRLSFAKNDALDQLILGGRQQSINEILTERNQPLNEISAVMSGSQVAQPNFVNTPQAQVAGVDYAGMVQNNYNNQVKQQEIAQSGNNAMMGGMFGLAGTLGGAALRGPYSFLPRAA